MEGKNPGAKCELLEKCFNLFFPGCGYSWKNSQGVFDRSNKCWVKRSVFSTVNPERLPQSVHSRFRLNFPNTRTVWGFVGQDSTRANKATDSVFLLGNKSEGHFKVIAVGTVAPSPDDEAKLVLKSLVDDPETVTRVLQAMKTETKEYQATKGGRRARDQSDPEFEPPRKVGRPRLIREAPGKCPHYVSNEVVFPRSEISESEETVSASDDVSESQVQPEVEDLQKQENVQNVIASGNQNVTLLPDLMELPPLPLDLNESFALPTAPFVDFPVDCNWNDHQAPKPEEVKTSILSTPLASSSPMMSFLQTPDVIDDSSNWGYGEIVH